MLPSTNLGGNPELAVMKWGFILVTLYMGPLGLLLYVLADKEPRPGERMARALSYSASYGQQQRRTDGWGRSNACSRRAVISNLTTKCQKENRMWNTSAATFAFIAAIICGNVAYAHPELQSAEPAAGVATVSPKRITIRFNETVIAEFSGVELRDQSGKAIATGKSEADPANKKLLVAPVKEQLAPGDYKVEWHAVSDDTHRVKGSYSFSVTR